MKSFCKTKTIANQAEKQVDALKNLKDQETQLVNVNDDYEDKLLHSKERKMCRKKLDKIEELTSKIHDNNVKTVEFSNKNDPLTFLTKIRDGKITIERAKELQEDLNNNIKKIQKGIRTQEQNKTLANLNMLFNGRNEAISFIDGYGSMILKAKKWLLKRKQNKVEQDLKY